MTTIDKPVNTAQRAGLAEVAEREATGLVKDLYADIRQTLRVPLVNLIYRHLATEPHVLQWAWESVRPHLLSGAVAAQAAELRGAVSRAVLTWNATMLHAAAPTQASALVRTYNAGNCLNLVSLTHLLAACDTPQPRRTATTTATTPATMVYCLGDAGAEEPPPIPAMADLPQADVRTVLRLNRMGEPGEPQIVASLYRHLAVWPGLLQQIEPMLEVLHLQGRLDAARLQTVQSVRALVHSEPLAVAPRPPAFDDAFARRVAQFTNVTIPKMLPIGALLARALRG